METKVDRRIRKTKNLLRQGLAELMAEKSINEITVKELVETVDINRSTFYLHYTDIYDMLQKTEDELMNEIVNIISPVSEKKLSNMDNGYPYLVKLFTMLDNNLALCKALCGPHGDMAFITKIEEYIAQSASQHLSKMFMIDIETDLKYIHSYCISGCVGIVKKWILESSDDTPEHIAKITYDMLMNSLESFFKGNK